MRIRVFKDRAKYEELVQLLNSPAPYLAIASHFHCDHSSVIYHARKLGIQSGDRPLMKISLFPQPIRNTEDHRHPILQQEKICEGKSYLEYVQRERERNTKRIVIGGFVF